MKMTDIIGNKVKNSPCSKSVIAAKRQAVKESLFVRSVNIGSESFESISEKDLYILYELYDSIFLDGWFKNNFQGKIKFRLSRQLKKAAGNTKTSRNIKDLKPEDKSFEVKISLNHLMFFDDTDRVKTVGGIEAASMLDGMMLVFEHELCHVMEFIIYGTSNCNRDKFKTMIRDIFGHEESTHNLVSLAESNYHRYGLRAGDNVTFDYNGQTLKGIIISMNKNASVLSPDSTGKYIDRQGQRYKRYNVPPALVKKQ